MIPGQLIVPTAIMAGNLGKVTLTLNALPAGFQPGGVARLWIAKCSLGERAAPDPSVIQIFHELQPFGLAAI